MKIKTTERYHHTNPREEQKLKGLETQMLTNDVEQSELNNRGNAKWDNSLENGLFSYKVKHISISNPTP